TTAVDHVRRDQGEFGGIVGDQAVAAADQFQRELALAGAGLAGDQHADREHFQEHAVQGGLRSQLAREVVLQERQQLVAALGADPQRGVGFLGHLAQVGGHRLVLGDDQRHRPGGGDLVDHLPALARIQPVEEVQFLRADDLDLVRVDDVEVAGQRGPACLRGARFQHARFAAHAGQPAQPHAFVDAVVELSCGEPVQAFGPLRRAAGGLRGGAGPLCQLGRRACFGGAGRPATGGLRGTDQPYWRSSRTARWCLSTIFSRWRRSWLTSLSNNMSMEAYMSASAACACSVAPARCCSLSTESTTARLISLSSRRWRRSSLDSTWARSAGVTSICWPLSWNCMVRLLWWCSAAFGGGMDTPGAGPWRVVDHPSLQVMGAFFRWASSLWMLRSIPV